MRNSDSSAISMHFKEFKFCRLISGSEISAFVDQISPIIHTTWFSYYPYIDMNKM